MVEVSVTASVKVAGGPTVPLGTTLEPESYTYASVDLDAGTASTPKELVLLPGDGEVVLLALVAKKRGGTTAGAPATVTITPKSGTKSGSDLTVDGTLLIANAGVLVALVAGGPRALTVNNADTDPVTVDVIACHSSG
jgi:hypothetical protein